MTSAIHQVLPAPGARASRVWPRRPAAYAKSCGEGDLAFETEDHECGTNTAPGGVPKLSETPGAIRWSGACAPHNLNHEVCGGPLGLPDAELDQPREQGLG